MELTKVTKGIVKLYFLGALAGSFTHLVHAGTKGQLATWEAVSLPFMIDGLAIIGMIMRSNKWATRTRKIGFRVQMGMGLVSFAGNAYAAHSVAGIMYGFGLVAGYVFAEWLSDQLVSADAESQALAIAEAERIAREAAELAEAKKQAAIAKGKATRARNQRTRKAQTKALESLLK